ncbi:hypothetical protein CMI41_02565 [Candidatus Pacearchaeota archaeon]|nr:hypothetical protein [Candidatus Pacearchaeota archaeon]|tara:strand:- start:108 stop:548 length:441 start_codon:yes stop_codon:yes gene_type:complete
MRRIYNDEALYDNWLKRVEKNGIEGLSNFYSNLVIRFIKDMALGVNVAKSSKKGARSKKRLNALKQKVIFVMKGLEERGLKDITKLKAETVHKFFEEMRDGTILNRYGKPYLSTGDYIKDFKAFWHWYQKTMGKEGIAVLDITDEL